MHILVQNSILLGTYKIFISLLTVLHGGLSGNHHNQFWMIFCPKICLFLRYAHITPNFWAPMDPTRCHHNFPTSWCNSEYLWFSGRCPFNRLAGYYEASNGQNGSFWGQEYSLLETWSNFFGTLMTGHKKCNFVVLIYLMYFRPNLRTHIKSHNESKSTNAKWPFISRLFLIITIIDHTRLQPCYQSPNCPGCFHKRRIWSAW